jgi:hypothetical protein
MVLLQTSTAPPASAEIAPLVLPEIKRDRTNDKRMLTLHRGIMRCDEAGLLALVGGKETYWGRGTR